MEPPILNSDDTIDLDDKMTEETRKFVIQSLKTMRPADLCNFDTRMITKLKEAQYEKLFHLFDFSQLIIDEIKVKSELDDGHEIEVTRYEPKIPPSTSHPPVITVFFHGGGYCINSRKTHHLTIGMLAMKSQSIWYSVGYRRCPQFKYPIPLLDCKSVLNWILNEFGEKAKIGICGDSSGGQIAAILAHHFKQKLAHQILIYPCVSFGGHYDSYRKYEKDCYLLVPKVIKHFADCLHDDITQIKNELDVINYVDFTHLPKCLLICAELDPLVDDSRHYYEKLKQENVECNFLEIKGTIHGFFSSPLSFQNAFNEAQTSISNFLHRIKH